jgi:hypothetical protein
VIRLWLLALVCVLAACVEEQSGQPDAPSLTAQELRQCQADGGEVGIAGLSGGEICVRPTPDARQSCRVSSDCAAYCDATTRTCAATDYPFGCRDYLDEDGTVQSICID